MSTRPSPRTLLLTAAALLAFAGNSLLCRRALRDAHIDPATFGSVRLAAGALTLWLVVRLRRGAQAPRRADPWAAAALFAYVALFSWAYLALTAGTGALVLFGAVQLTMFSAGLRHGERFSALAWTGLALAVIGLVVLVAPGVEAPPPLAAASMAAAGIAWGLYSLRGRGVPEPLAATASNFALATPLALLLSAATWHAARATPTGVWLAIASGALTSGIGYVIWYAALRGLGALQASTVQLAVPPIAALCGVLWLDESIGARMLGASVAVIGGIALVLGSRVRRAPP